MFKKTLAATALTLAILPAHAETISFVPFNQFFGQLSSTSLSAQMARPGSQVSEKPAFETMRSHVLGLYSGVSVRHSYLVDNHPYDCVPISQQPSVRAMGLKQIEAAPTIDPSPAPSAASSPAQLDPNVKVDAAGNAMGCEDGTIPMRRVTLEDVSKFKSLADFFRKGPSGTGAPEYPDPAIRPAVAATHKYAHSYQNVANFGGTNTIDVWSPYVDTSKSEIFSLAQFWYINRTGPVQTVEGGIQNYPGKYGVNKSVMFIYWTSDAYKSVGCYNLDCSGFVQTNKNIHLGAGFNNYSTDGGTQYTGQFAAYLVKGNWWIYYGGGAASNAIGYYPASAFHGRPMASTGATEIDYGGEVVGTTIWPPMGSGKFAATSFGHSSYQRSILYYDTSNRAQTANLTADQPSTRCFTDATHNNAGGTWGTYFYFGGPGGTGC